MSLFKKTGILVFCLFGVIACLTSALAAWTLYGHMTREYISKGVAIARSIAGASQEILLNRDAAMVQSLIDQYHEIEGVAYVFVTDREGQVVSHTFVPEIPPLLREFRGAPQELSYMEIKPYGRVIDIAEPILAGVAGYVHVGMDKELILRYFWQAIIRMQVLLFFIFWGCVGILYLVIRRISSPLGQLTEYARRLAAHDFSATIDIRTRDELNLLGRAMQSMGQELSLLFSEMESEVDKATVGLRDHMAYLAAIIDNLADGLLVVGVTGEITIINPAMREFFDLEAQSYAGLASAVVFPSEVVAIARGIRKCDKEILSAEIPLSRGRTGKAVGSSIFIEEPSRRCLGGVILIRDITHEKELDQLKTDFISTVSHELRTPMTSVLGFSKIIKKKLEQVIFPLLSGNEEVEKPIAQVRGNMEIIVTEAERLTELINDVLDIARMEAGELTWRDGNVSMARILEQSRESTRGLWASKHLEVETRVEDGLPEVYGDYDRLVQVIVNLISNAVKFTETSPIVCTAEQKGDFVVVSVADKGSGIRRADLALVFDKFKQVGDTLTGKPEGTGLGLPICRQIVERHDGRIWAESEPGKGSVFYFSIPVSKMPTAFVDTDADGLEAGQPCCNVGNGIGSDPAKPPLILIVDDDPSVTCFLAQVFEEQGFRVQEAGNGVDALVKAQELLPDLITMDLMMPGMDGQEAIRRLRLIPTTRHIPILVITALSGKEGKIGDMALVKPVDEASLSAAARVLLREKECCKSCIVLGERKACDLDGLMVLCTGDVTFATVEDFWNMVGKGFAGTVFVPAEEMDKLELERLTSLTGISIIILPAYGCQE